MTKNRAQESKNKDEAPGEVGNDSHRKARRLRGGLCRLAKPVKGGKLGEFMPGNRGIHAR